MGFETPDIGMELFYSDVEHRMRMRGGMAFKDFEQYIPKSLMPNPSLDYPEFTIERAKLTIKWFAILRKYSFFQNPTLRCGSKSKSSYQRHWRFPNVLMMKCFIDSFVEAGGKIQRGDKPNFLRANLNREGDCLESFWENKLGKDRVLDKGTLIKTDDHDYMSTLFIEHIYPHFPKKEHKEELYRIWDTINHGWSPDHDIYPANDLRDAAGYTKYTYGELEQYLRNFYKKNPEDTIVQCSDLRGRDLCFVADDTYITFKGCINCKHNSSELKIGYPVHLQRCRQLKIAPIGTRTPTRRNEFAAKIQRDIRDRDKGCIVGQILGEECKGEMEISHVVSAWNTAHRLQEFDGLLLCNKHNQKMGNRGLLEYYPGLKKWATQNNINTKGLNLDITEWPRNFSGTKQ